MFVQVSWLLASPKMAHGVGSKDADNVIKGGMDYQSGLVVFGQPLHGSRHGQ